MKIIYDILFVLTFFSVIFSTIFGPSFSYFDDILTLLITPIVLLKSSKYNKLLIFSICYVILKSILFLFWETRITAFFSDLLFLYKPIIFFFFFYYYFKELKLKDLVIRIEIFNQILLVSAIYGIAQFLSYYIFRVDLPFAGGKFAQGLSVLGFDRFGIRRVSSIFGHPLFFAYVMVLWGLFNLYRRNILYFFVSILAILSCFSRMALLLLILGSTILSYLNSSKATKKIIALLTVGVIIGIIIILPTLLYYYNQIWEGYEDDAIKMIGIKNGLILFKMNPLGYGLGSYGTSSSIGSSAYKFTNISYQILDLLKELKSGIESLATILIVQLGIDGLIIFFAPIINYVRKTNFNTAMLIITLLLSISSPYNLFFILSLSLYMSYGERKFNYRDLSTYSNEEAKDFLFSLYSKKLQIR